MKPVLEGLMIVPEEIILYCISKFGPHEDNAFKTSMEHANDFRLAGLTPIFLCNENFKEVIVTTQEKLDRQLN